jgi:hypothetical protein
MGITTGFQTAGTDLGSVFAPYITGGSLGAITPVGTTGYQVAGLGNADFNVVFAPLAHGTSHGSNVGYQTSGTDISSFFAAIGTTLYVIIESSGTGTFTLPTNLPASGVTLTIEIWGGGGGGESGTGLSEPAGGEGAYVRSTFALTTTNNGQTIAFSVGIGGVAVGGNGTESVVSSGSFALTTMTAGPGHGAVSGPGAGGTASGGNASNTNGSAGTVAGITGTVPGDGSPHGGGGAGESGNGASPARPGAAGAVVFAFTG